MRSLYQKLLSRFTLKDIEPRQLGRLIEAGAVIERDSFGPKVIQLAEQRYLKIFYQKYLFSLSRIHTRAHQFDLNARRLKKRGIITVGILDTFKTKPAAEGQLRRDCVLYHGLPGDTVRQILQKKPEDEALSAKFGAYIAQLHNAGVMFRSLHLGNVIQLPDGRFGLIDIADMRVNFFTLNNWQRKRNFLHVFRYRKDIDLLSLDAFIRGYFQTNGSRGRGYLEKAIRAAVPRTKR